MGAGYLLDGGDGGCHACAEGTVGDVSVYCPFGETERKFCPDNSTSTLNVATGERKVDLARAAECFCHAGYYMNTTGAGADAAQCVECPVDHYCKHGSTQPTKCFTEVICTVCWRAWTRKSSLLTLLGVSFRGPGIFNGCTGGSVV